MCPSCSAEALRGHINVPFAYKELMSAFKYFTKIDIVEACEGQLRPDCQSAASVTRSEDD